MDDTLREEDLLTQEWLSQDGRVSLRVLHTPTGLRCEAKGQAGQSRDAVFADLLEALRKQVREHEQ
jgi:hypothetical protein